MTNRHRKKADVLHWGNIGVATTIILATIISFYFHYTYPLNLGSMDNINYLAMVYGKKSNLIHASGYPAFLILSQDIFSLHPDRFQYDIPWLNYIQLLQATLHISFLIICTILIYSTFGRLAAALFSLALGLNVLFLSGVGSFAPEWLLGDLLALVLLLAISAFYQTNVKLKVTLYCLSALLFSFSYLVKFNCLVIAPAIYLLILADSIEVKIKITISIFIVVIFFGVIFVFIYFFHTPTTKAKRLTYDHAWVLIDSLPDGYFNLPNDKLGPATLRWKILSSVVPQDYSKAAAYCCEDSGAPAEQKLPYQTLYRDLMGRTEAELQRMVSNYKLPIGFKSSVSAIPLYWYVGLKETDDLGIKVFKESIITMPWYYLEKIKNRAFYLKDFNAHIVPFLKDSLELNFENSNSSIITYTTSASKAPEHHLYWSPSQTLWRPGLIFFQKLNAIWGINYLKPTALLLIISYMAISWSHKKLRWVNSALFLTIFLFILASCILLGMRYKEVISIFPVMCILGALSLSYLINHFKKPHGLN